MLFFQLLKGEKPFLLYLLTLKQKHEDSVSKLKEMAEY